MLKLKHLNVLAIFICLSFVLRLFTFFPSVINHDESTYILISKQLLGGDLYFVDVIDTKPVGIFLIYAFFHKVFLGSIFLMRLGAAIFLAFTAYWLYRARLVFDGDERAAVAGGTVYLFLTSIFTFFGVSPNTETFFVGFTALALWVMFSSKYWYQYLGAGLILGIGFIIKYVVLFDGIAFGVFLVLDKWLTKKPLWEGLVNAILMAAGAAIPILGVMGYYASIGHLDEFWFYTFDSSGRYPITRSFDVYVVYVTDFFLRFLPITVFFVLTLISKSIAARLKLFGGLWALMILIVVLIPGKKFGHYFIQFMLPFSFVAGTVWGMAKSELPRFLRPVFSFRIGLILIGLVMITNWIFQKMDYLDKSDDARKIAAFIKPKLEADDGIYTSISHQIIHHLVDRKSPLKHVHPSLFWEQKHINALEIDVAAEMKRITDNPPKFMIWRGNLIDNRMDEFLLDHYRLVKKYNRELVYQRIELD